MFIGHFGVAFGAKKITPALSLGLFFIAVQFLDLLWPILILLHIEHAAIVPGITKMSPIDFTDYPISHSLLMSVIWGILFGSIFWLVKKDFRSALILGLCVVSHWVLDIVVHRPDLPLYPGNSQKLGFGLWNYPVIEPVIEMLIFLAGFILYLKTTVSKNAIGKYGLWVLIAFLIFSHFYSFFSPEPTDIGSVAWSAQIIWVLIILAFWVDHNRVRKSLK
jgi:hypothetical protein